MNPNTYRILLSAATAGCLHKYADLTGQAIYDATFDVGRNVYSMARKLFTVSDAINQSDYDAEENQRRRSVIEQALQDAKNDTPAPLL